MVFTNILELMVEELESYFEFRKPVSEYIDSAICQTIYTEKVLNSTF
jgi:hypothetical protein